MKENDPQDTNKQIMDSLIKIQYHPQDETIDLGALRRGLVRGDKKIVYPILQWIFDNAELIKKLAYLSK